MDFIELEGVCSDGSFLSSVNLLEIHLGDVFKYDLSKELSETLVKDQDGGFTPREKYGNLFI